MALLGKAYFELGRYADAEIELYNALLFYGRDAELRLLYAESLDAIGRHQEAVGEYRKVLELDPTGRFGAEARNKLGM
jgi:tetratricopeptide (TPR) repeat protein